MKTRCRYPVSLVRVPLFQVHFATAALREMRQLVGKPPVAECKVTAAEAHRGAHAALADFVGGLKRHLARTSEFEWTC